MRIDTKTDRSAAGRDYDVCIIGSGPAGITLARSLAAKGASVALMEAGDLEYTDESQEKYVGDIVGLDYFPLDTARLRYFGGSSNHWAGWCRALEYHDFRPKPFNAFSGWPITKADLDPYRAEADRIVEIPSATEMPDLPVPGGGYDFTRIQVRYSPPTRFGERFGDEIFASDAIVLMLNANLTGFRLSEDGASVEAATFRSYDPADAGFDIRAQHYVLACGGIENPRLLLNFGIGNRFDQVGRHFCEHPHYTLGDVVLNGEVPEQLMIFAPSPEFIAKNEVLNFGLRIDPGGIPKEYPASVVRDDFRDAPFTLDLAAHMARLEAAGPRRAVAEADLPKVVATARLRTAHEQAMNPDSRVKLSAERDAFGLARAALDWHLTDLDIHTMRTAVTSFAARMAAQNMGRTRIKDWLLAPEVRVPDTSEDEVGGKHHMCATRMSADPRHGVVDANCTVHGMTNFHVAGSSVFSTPGHANPTYTIVQLALRQGDHLGQLLQGA